MSAYDNDPRVTRASHDFFCVVCPADFGTVGATVFPNREDGGWAAQVEGGHRLTTFPTADEAIRSLIGDPR